MVFRHDLPDSRLWPGQGLFRDRQHDDFGCCDFVLWLCFLAFKGNLCHLEKGYYIYNGDHGGYRPGFVAVARRLFRDADWSEFLFFMGGVRLNCRRSHNV